MSTVRGRECATDIVVNSRANLRETHDYIHVRDDRRCLEKRLYKNRGQNNEQSANCTRVHKNNFQKQIREGKEKIYHHLGTFHLSCSVTKGHDDTTLEQ